MDCKLEKDQNWASQGKEYVPRNNMKSASNSHSVKSHVSSVHDNVPLYRQRSKEPGAL